MKNAVRERLLTPLPKRPRAEATGFARDESRKERSAARATPHGGHDAALLDATTEALVLLATARRLAFAPPDGGESWSSCVETISAVTGCLASAVPGWPTEGSRLPRAGGAGRAADDPAARLATHLQLTQTAAALARSARARTGDAGAAIWLGEQIIDLQLRVALQRTRLSEALGRQPSRAAPVDAFGSELAAGPGATR